MCTLAFDASTLRHVRAVRPAAWVLRLLDGSAGSPRIRIPGALVKETDVEQGTAAPATPFDSAAFSREFEEVYPALLVVASAEVGRSDADDVVHDAAIAAMGKLDQFQPGTSFRAWMTAFVRYTAANHRRRNRRRAKWTLRLANSARPEAPSEPSAAGLDPAIQTALDQLSYDQRCCFLLRVTLSLPYSAISESLSIPEATVRSHVFRARRHLLEKLGDGQGGQA